MSSCPSFCSFDPHARSIFGSHPSFFILPFSDLLHQSRCIREHCFGLDINLCKNRICSSWSVSFSVYSLNCIALGLCSSSVQTLPEAFSILCFLRFHARTILGHCNSTGFPITTPAASSQNILLGPLPLGASRGLQTDPPGRSRVDDGTDSTRHTQRKKTEAQGVVSQTRCIGFSHSQRSESIFPCFSSSIFEYLSCAWHKKIDTARK